MGQVNSLGKLSKKGQVAPAGVPAPDGPPARGNGGAAPPPRRPRSNGPPVIGKRYPTYLYTTILSSFPMTCLWIFIAAPFLMSMYAVFSQDTNELDVEMKSFEIINHQSVKRRDATQAAVKDWKRMLDAFDYKQQSLTGSFDDPNAKQPGTTPWRRLYIQYKVDLPALMEVEGCAVLSQVNEDDYNILTRKEYLVFIHELEERIKALPNWGRVCFRSHEKAGASTNHFSHKPPCVPFSSFQQYYFPGGLEAEPYNLAGDQRFFWDFRTGSPMQEPASKVLDTFYQNPSWKWFGDTRHSPDNRRSFLMRTQITLGHPKEDYPDDIADLFLKPFQDLMDNVADKTEYAKGDEGGAFHIPKGLVVTYGGDGLIKSRLSDAQARDRWFVFLGVVAVMAITAFYTHSFFIAAMATCQCAMTYFTASFIHHYSRDEDLSLLTLMSFYIILSMSTDGVMVFFNTFRQSAFMETNGRINTLNVPQRMAFCFRKAGASITVSHLTAGAAFVVNTVSSVPAIRDFGVFMVWLVLINLYMFLTVFPCVLLLHHFLFSKKRRNAQRQKEIILRRRTQTHPNTLRNALRSLDKQAKSANGVATAFLNTRPVRAASILPPDASANPPPTEANATTVEERPKVSTGEGGGRFGLSKLQAKLKKRVPKTLEQIKAEHEVIFEQFSSAGGFRPPKSRRKQPVNSIVQLPAEYTVMGGMSKVLPTPAGACPDSNTEDVPLEVYRERHRAAWDDEAKSMGPTTFLGKGLFCDPTSQQPLECGRRLPMIAQALAECHTELRVPRDMQGEDELAMSERDPGEDPADLGAAAGATGTAAVDMANGAPLNNGVAHDAPQQPAPVLGYSPPEPQAAPAQLGCMQRVMAWYDARSKVRRRFGVFGKRVGETRDEKDRRLMSKRAKREAYTNLERFFYNTYTPMIAVIFPFVLLVYLVKMICFIALLLSHLEISIDKIRLLDDQEQFDRFADTSELFPVEGSCDLCGPYFRPYNDFPAPFGRGSPGGTLSSKKVEQWEQCGQQMFNQMDYCGECGGTNDCLDCLGQLSKCITYTAAENCTAVVGCEWAAPVRKGVLGHCVDKASDCLLDNGQVGKAYAGWTFDDCDVCVLPGHSNEDVAFNSMDVATDGSPRCEALRVPIINQCQDFVHECSSQAKVDKCNRCFVRAWLENRNEDWMRNLYPAPSPGLARCNVVCSADTCLNGRCDTITGECVCHSDYINGFWDHIIPYNETTGHSGDCAKCLGSFYPSPNQPMYTDVGTSLIPSCSLECREGDPDPSGTCNCKCDLTSTNAKFLSGVGRTGDRGRCMCTVCPSAVNGTANGTVPSAIPRAGDTDWDPKVIVAVGWGCNQKRRSLCENGELDLNTGECLCNDDFNDGGSCILQESCSLHGKRDSVTGQCVCHGCWTGADCSEHVCKNTGICLDMLSNPDPSQWKCDCNAGDFTGNDCTGCPVGCQAHSKCPLQWTTSMSQRLKTGELKLNEVDDKFKYCWVNNERGCKGYWSGNHCDKCDVPLSVPAYLRTTQIMCDANGEIFGCDGEAATDSHYKWVDACGTCTDIVREDPTDKSHCKGCDGVIGSGKVSDSCGNCGGHDYTCNCIYDPPKVEAAIPIEVVWGIVPTNSVDIDEMKAKVGEPTTKSVSEAAYIPFDYAFDFGDEEVQRKLVYVCDEMLKKITQGFSWAECLMVEFSHWSARHALKRNRITRQNVELTPCGSAGECRALAAIDANASPDFEWLALEFPGMAREHVTWVFFHFIKASRKTHLAGFSTADPSDLTLRLRWFRLQMFLPATTAHSSSARAMYNGWDKLLRRNINALPADTQNPAKFGVAFHWSELWVEYFTKEQAENGTIYAIVLGIVAFSSIMVIFTCSLSLTLISAGCVTGVVIMSMSYMQAAGWKVGPAEQVGLTCLVGMSAEYTVHITEGYLEYLHASQSSLLARKTTRAHALAGALQRAGVPITVSAFAVTVSSLFLLGCRILVYRRIAQIILMVTLLSAFHALVILPALLVFVGPTTGLRNWTTRTLWAASVALCMCLALAIIFLTESAKDPNGNDLL